ncbi:hypothetical protein FRC12_003253 [Ceratobasidium sp. 428]|nr:hypothetical protein FRC12_003253 [Ceratobasidium sp. 428]
MCAASLIDGSVGKEWTLSVTTCNRPARGHKAFTIIVQGPPTGRFSSLRTPSHGTVVSVRGILSAIAADETAVVLLGAITFVPSSGFHRLAVAASGSSPSTALGNVGRTKRERRQGLVLAARARASGLARK